MPQIAIEFLNKGLPEINCSPDLSDCPICLGLPELFRKAVLENPSLHAYLHMIPIEEIGIPVYMEKLDKSYNKMNNPNVIYACRDRIFTHVLFDHNDGRPNYISIEPCLGVNIDSVLLEVDKRLLNMADKLAREITDNAEERKALFLRCLEQICTVTENPNREQLVSGGDSGRFHMGNRKHKIEVTQWEYEALQYTLVRDKVGLGILQPMVRDSQVEDISCSGTGVIFIEHKVFKSVKTAVTFTNMEELDAFVMRLAERIRKPVSVASPIVDATLPDGSRINVVYGRDVSKRGSNFSIRRFMDKPMSILEIIAGGCCDYKMAAYLSIMIGEGMNAFICGETASGKTTTMNAVTTFIPPNAKIVSIEDTPELMVPHPNWIREVVATTKEGQSGVNMFDLLKAALRQRPNEIIIGEIRGAEGAIAFQAMQTGHSVMATFHASTVERLIQRLTGNPINVPKTYVDCLNLCIIQSAVKLPSGKTGRRMVSINEIVGFDPVSQSFSFVEAFQWDSVTDTFRFTGDGNSYLLEYKIAPKLGIPPSKKRRVYAEVDRRAKIFQKLHQQGVTDFYELLQVMAKAQREGLF
jgi:flagellar protein FlaI